MQDVFVIALDGMKLMPANRAKARKLLKKAKRLSISTRLLRFSLHMSQKRMYSQLNSAKIPAQPISAFRSSQKNMNMYMHSMTI